jgi:hypothetical protein
MSLIKKIKNFFIFFSFIFTVLLFCGNISFVLSAGIVPQPSAGEGNYTLNEMFQTVINVAEWIWGIAGSLALLAFVYGGIMFLISGGSSEKVAKAKQIIIGATLGLVIVFVSYIIIGFIFTALGIPEAKNWATSNWF